ncbi:MAG: phage Tail Collar domain protein [Acidobacteria bacterium]|nr:phage Tail Collar domain protein [Acidobacteriota bacterium]
MASPFVAEIRIFACNFAPTGWAQCNGQILPISQNTALFSLLGTYYGGNGQSTFALPNLEGQAALGTGDGSGLSQRFLGEMSGTESVTLLQSEISAHTHTAGGSTVNNGGSQTPTGNIWATSPAGRGTLALWGTPATGAMNPNALNLTGGGLPHNNLQPYLTLNFCIAMQGVFPPRS